MTIFSIAQLFGLMIPFFLFIPHIPHNFYSFTVLNNWKSAGVKKEVRDAYAGLRDSKKELIELERGLTCIDAFTGSGELEGVKLWRNNLLFGFCNIK